MNREFGLLNLMNTPEHCSAPFHSVSSKAAKSTKMAAAHIQTYVLHVTWSILYTYLIIFCNNYFYIYIYIYISYINVIYIYINNTIANIYIYIYIYIIVLSFIHIYIRMSASACVCVCVCVCPACLYQCMHARLEGWRRGWMEGLTDE